LLSGLGSDTDEKGVAWEAQKGKNGGKGLHAIGADRSLKTKEKKKGKGGKWGVNSAKGDKEKWWQADKVGGV